MNLREWALPVYTILMQLAVGALFSLWLIRSFIIAKYGERKMDQLTIIPILIIFSTVVLAMVGSHFHLSKPNLSYLAVRNFRYSWLSREVVFTFVTFLSTGSLLVLTRFVKGFYRLKTGLGWVAILTGFATVYCMARIYLLPTQIAWNSSATIFSYYAVMLLLGTISLNVILLMDLRFSAGGNPEDLDVQIKVVRQATIWLTVASAIAAFLVIALGFFQIEFLSAMELTSAQVSLRLILGLYKPLFVMRIGLTLLGVIWLVVVVSYYLKTQRSLMGLLGPVYIACIMVLIGEILERFLFYATHVRTGI